MIFATTFLFWWHATLVKFGWEVAPQCFLFEWKSASEKFGREVMPQRFLFQSKSVSHTEVVLPLFGAKLQANCATPIFSRTELAQRLMAHSAGLN